NPPQRFLNALQVSISVVTKHEGLEQQTNTSQMREGLSDDAGRDRYRSFIIVVLKLITVVERLLAMNGAVRIENVSRRRFAFDDVLQTHQTIKQRLGARGTDGNVNVHRNAAIDG